MEVMTTSTPRQEVIICRQQPWEGRTEVHQSSALLLTKKELRDSSAASRISSSTSSSSSASEYSSPITEMAVGPTLPLLLVQTTDRLHQLSIAGSEEQEDEQEDSLSVSPDSLVEGLMDASSVQSLSFDDDSAWCLPPRKRSQTEAPSTPSKRRRQRPRHLRDPDSPSAEEVNSRVCLPSQRSLQYKIWFRLQRSNPIFCPPDIHSSNQDDTSLYVLYRWLRVRFAAGMTRSSLSLLHNMLTKGYEQAKHLLEKVYEEDSDNDVHRLLKLRQRLAGLWCIYAHVILELGQEALKHQTLNAKSTTSMRILSDHNCKRMHHQETSTVCSPSRRRGRPSHKKSDTRRSLNFKKMKAVGKELTPKKRRKSSGDDITPRNGRVKVLRPSYTKTEKASVTIQDVQNHAMSILSAARTCPLVRNHTLVVLSMGRLIVSGHALETANEKKSEEELSCENVNSSITSAIAACWDSMDCCHNKHDTPQRFQIDPSPSKSIALISHFQSDNRPIHKGPRVSEEEIESSMESVLTLPTRLREALDFSNTIFCDRNATRSLCVELNRLSRLGERIQTKSDVRLRASDGDTLLDHLPLFAAYDHDHASEIQHPNSVCIDVEEVGKEHFLRNTHPRNRTVLWQWQW